MQRLQQARKQAGGAGEPIHNPLQALAAADVFIRRGGLTMIAAGPGTGKSMLTQSIVQRGDARGRNSVFYFSADTGAPDVYVRSASIATGRTTSDLENELRQSGPARIDEEVVPATAHMWYSFAPSPTEQRLVDQVTAYAEIHGAYPQVIVVDNLANLDMGMDDEWAALQEASRFLSVLAKDTGAAIIATHHVTGEWENGNVPIPLSGIRGKVTKEASMVLTLCREESRLFVSAVKNRAGKADATGRSPITLSIDYERSLIQG